MHSAFNYLPSTLSFLRTSFDKVTRIPKLSPTPFEWSQKIQQPKKFTENPPKRECFFEHEKIFYDTVIFILHFMWYLFSFAHIKKYGHKIEAKKKKKNENHYHQWKEEKCEREKINSVQQQKIIDSIILISIFYYSTYYMYIFWS